MVPQPGIVVLVIGKQSATTSKHRTKVRHKRVMGREAWHRGIRATTMQVQSYGRGTRTVTQPPPQAERPRSTTQLGTATNLVFPLCSSRTLLTACALPNLRADWRRRSALW